MKRLLADVCVFALLFILLKLLSFVSPLLWKWDILILLGVPLFVGCVRGVLERRFLKKVPTWVSGCECGLVVLTSTIILCALGSSSDPHTNFWTRFGAFFLIFIFPSFGLGIAGFIIGLSLADNRRLDGHS